MARLSNNFSNLLVLILAVPAVLNSLDADISVNARPQGTRMERRGFASDVEKGAKGVKTVLKQAASGAVNGAINGATNTINGGLPVTGLDPAAAPAQQAPPAIPDNSTTPATTSDPSTDPNAAPAAAPAQQTPPVVPDNSATPATTPDPSTDPNAAPAPAARRGLGSVLFEGAKEVGEDVLNHVVNGGTTPAVGRVPSTGTSPAAAPAQQAPPVVPDNSATPATTPDPSTDPNVAPAAAARRGLGSVLFEGAKEVGEDVLNHVVNGGTTPAVGSVPSTGTSPAAAPAQQAPPAVPVNSAIPATTPDPSTGGLPATGPGPTTGQLTSPPTVQRRSFASSAGKLIKGAEQVGKTIAKQAAGGAINGAINGATNTIAGGFPVTGPGLAAPPVQQTPTAIPDDSATPATTPDTGSGSTDPTTDAQTNPPIDPNADSNASSPADPTGPSADATTNPTASGNATEPASAQLTGNNLTPPKNVDSTAVINQSSGTSNKGAQRRRSGCVVKRSGPIGARDFAACKREEIIRRAVGSSIAARRAYALEELD